MHSRLGAGETVGTLGTASLCRTFLCFEVYWVSTKCPLRPCGDMRSEMVKKGPHALTRRRLTVLVGDARSRMYVHALGHVFMHWAQLASLGRPVYVPMCL